MEWEKREYVPRLIGGIHARMGQLVLSELVLEKILEIGNTGQVAVVEEYTNPDVLLSIFSFLRFHEYTVCRHVRKEEGLCIYDMDLTSKGKKVYEILRSFAPLFFE